MFKIGTPVVVKYDVTRTIYYVKEYKGMGFISLVNVNNEPVGYCEYYFLESAKKYNTKLGKLFYGDLETRRS